MTNTVNENSSSSNEDSPKVSNGEAIVRMLCEGKSVKSIREALNLTAYNFDSIYEKVSRGARLPFEKKSFPALKVDILENLKIYQEYVHEAEVLRKKYRSSLTEFF